LRIIKAIAPLLVGLWLVPTSTLCQDSGEQGTMFRGDRAEISVTVRDSSGEIITAPATVKLVKNGQDADQSATSQGRAFFIPRGWGDFTIAVEATGYKSAQKDVSVTLPVQLEVDVYLERELAPNESTGVPGAPILAPKAQQALAKGTKALREGNLDEAQKQIGKAMQLAPSNPQVLYIQGMVYMKQSNWVSAESVLQKSQQIAPNQPRVLSALGMALCNQRKYAEAIPLLEKAAQVAPASGWETYWALAKAYYYREQYAPALKMVEQAQSKTHTPISQVDMLQAQCLTAVGRYEDAAQVLRKLLQTGTDGPDAATARHWLDKLADDGKIQR
jgi:tetratricopeptide (TPR) repeat protein